MSCMTPLWRGIDAQLSRAQRVIAERRTSSRAELFSCPPLFLARFSLLVIYYSILPPFKRE